MKKTEVVKEMLGKGTIMRRRNGDWQKALITEKYVTVLSC